MSERELQRIEVLSEVIGNRRTVASAAAVLALSTRQVRRLLKAYRLGGGGATTPASPSSRPVRTIGTGR